MSTGCNADPIRFTCQQESFHKESSFQHFSNKTLCLLLHFISLLFFLLQKVFKILCFCSLLCTVALHDEAKLSKQSKEYSLKQSLVLIRLLLKLTKYRVSWHSNCLTLCLLIIVFYTFTNMT